MSDWNEIGPEKDTDPEDLVAASEKVERIIAQISKEFKLAHNYKYDVEKAELTAALCLEAQKQIAEFLSDAEIYSKERKWEVESVSAERYFHYKESATDKISESALNHFIAKDEKVKEAKSEQFKAEANYKKWQNLLSILKDGHIYFRGLAKGKNDWSS